VDGQGGGQVCGHVDERLNPGLAFVGGPRDQPAEVQRLGHADRVQVRLLALAARRTHLPDVPEDAAELGFGQLMVGRAEQRLQRAALGIRQARPLGSGAIGVQHRGGQGLGGPPLVERFQVHVPAARNDRQQPWVVIEQCG